MSHPARDSQHSQSPQPFAVGAASRVLGGTAFHPQ